MAKLFVLITGQLEKVDDLTAAMENAGVEGATMIDSYGVRSYRELGDGTEILPGMRSALTMLRENQQQSIILLVVLYEESMVETVRQTTEDILGDLRTPETGLAFVLNLEWVARKQRVVPEQNVD